jgi:hypothetical protein
MCSSVCSFIRFQTASFNVTLQVVQGIRATPRMTRVKRQHVVLHGGIHWAAGAGLRELRESHQLEGRREGKSEKE